MNTYVFSKNDSFNISSSFLFILLRFFAGVAVLGAHGIPSSSSDLTIILMWLDLLVMNSVVHCLSFGFQQSFWKHHKSRSTAFRLLVLCPES
jgi:hypothetical protein